MLMDGIDIFCNLEKLYFGGDLIMSGELYVKFLFKVEFVGFGVVGIVFNWGILLCGCGVV